MPAALRYDSLPSFQGSIDMEPDPIETMALRKIAWRLMPLLTAGCVMNVLVRNNVNFAALQMNQQIGLTSTEFGVGAGILMLAYCIFEVPSDLALYRFGPRRWLSLILIVSGAIAACCALTSGPLTFYILRMSLGLAAAGFIPGVAFLLSVWFPIDFRARILAIFLLGIPAAYVIGNPVSGALLGLDGFAGLPGWRWVLIIEGLPSVLVGLAILYIVGDRPADANWLTVEERLVVEDRLASEERHREITRFRLAMQDPRVLTLAAIAFGYSTASFGVSIWLPQIIKAALHSNLEVGFAGAAPYLIASFGMLIWANWADRHGRYVDSLALACGTAAAGLLLAATVSTFWLSLLWLSVAVTGIYAARAIFWTLPPRFLTGAAAAGALGFIYAVSTLGGFVGPAMIGWLQSITGSFSAGLAAMGCFLLVSAALCLTVDKTVPAA